MGVSYEHALEALAARLSPAAVRHSERVADTAASLAAAYGVDEADARLAGLLHDWHRETPWPALLERAGELGIEVTDVDRDVPYLLHGPVGEADVGLELPGLSEEVLRAIGAHTYGDPEMTPLGMVLYVADSIEPSRHQPGADSLRAAVGARPLSELFTEAYAYSLHHLVDARKRMHPKSVETWNRIVAGLER